MPDDELLRLGETNRLHLPVVLDAQEKRMIADPKASAFAANFAGQWLETRSLDAVTRDAKKFPEWGPELKDAMRTETRMFFESVMRDNRPISDFIDGKYTFVNELLAKHYGIDGVTGPDFRRVELTTDQRSVRFHPSQRARGFRLSFPDLGGAAQQISAGKCSQRPAAATAAGRPRVE